MRKLTVLNVYQIIPDKPEERRKAEANLFEDTEQAPMVQDIDHEQPMLQVNNPQRDQGSHTFLPGGYITEDDVYSEVCLARNVRCVT